MNKETNQAVVTEDEINSLLGELGDLPPLDMSVTGELPALEFVDPAAPVAVDPTDVIEESSAWNFKTMAQIEQERTNALQAEEGLVNEFHQQEPEPVVPEVVVQQIPARGKARVKAAPKKAKKPAEAPQAVEAPATVEVATAPVEALAAPAESVAEGVTPVPEGVTVQVIAQETKKKPKTAATRKHYADKVERITDRLGDKFGDFALLEADDAMLEGEALKKKQDETVGILKAMNVKEKMRSSFLFDYASGKTGSLNEVMRRVLNVIDQDGFVQLGEKGNLQANLLSKPYSAASALAMGRNSVNVMAKLKVLVQTDKGQYTANEDSLLMIAIEQRDAQISGKK